MSELIDPQAPPEVEVEQRVLLGGKARREFPDESRRLRIYGVRLPHRAFGGVRLCKSMPVDAIRGRIAAVHDKGATAAHADRPLTRYRVEPGLDVVAAVTLARTVPGLRESLADNVGGKLRIFNGPKNEVVDAIEMASVECGKCLLVARRGTCGELRVRS